ncbi:MAG TPA: hypothetical protein PLF16_00470 [Candidatus Staskawiczbacteria bacterium]|nr:hypothetical protein [Candidatus Staskawiczbacteria bacterium]
MKTITLILTIIFAVVIFVAGAALGAWYQKDVLAPEIGDCIQAKSDLNEALPKIEKCNTILKALQSPLVHEVGAFGNIKSLDVDKRDIVLYSEGADMDIKINNDVKIQKALVGGSSELVGLKDIKMDDVLSIILKFSDSGQATTSEIFIMTAVWGK